MLNEDDLRPGDVIQDAMGDFWHVHDDGKIWCSEPENRIGFEHARSAGPFKYASGCGPKRDTVQASEDDSVKHEGKWTRDDLPSVIKSHAYAGKYFTRLQELEEYMDAMLDHLNTHHPKPAPDLLSSAAECVLDAEDRVRSAKAERDAAIARAEAHAKGATRANLDRDTAYEELADMTNRAEKAERELAEEKRQHSDTIQVTDEQYVVLMRERDDAVRERCYWKARAEEAEADLEELSEEFADFRVEVVAEAVKYWESHPHEPNADPVVYAVRESDIEDCQRNEDGDWEFRHSGRVFHDSRDPKDRVNSLAHHREQIAQRVAIIRAIEAEQAVDPVEAKARELWETGRGPSVHIEFDDIAPDHRGEYLRIARHLLGQEAGDE